MFWFALLLGSCTSLACTGKLRQNGSSLYKSRRFDRSSARFRKTWAENPVQRCLLMYKRDLYITALTPPFFFSANWLIFTPINRIIDPTDEYQNHAKRILYRHRQRGLDGRRSGITMPRLRRDGPNGSFPDTNTFMPNATVILLSPMWSVICKKTISPWPMPFMFFPVSKLWRGSREIIVWIFPFWLREIVSIFALRKKS